MCCFIAFPIKIAFLGYQRGFIPFPNQRPDGTIVPLASFPYHSAPPFLGGFGTYGRQPQTQQPYQPRPPQPIGGYASAGPIPVPTQGGYGPQPTVPSNGCPPGPPGINEMKSIFFICVNYTYL